MKSHPLIIAGSGRSGTTWVLDVLAEANNLRPVFEPLNPFGVAEAQAFANRYIREDAYEPELKRFLEKVFNAELNYQWPKTRMVSTTMRPSITQMTSWDYNYKLLSRYKKFFNRYFSYIRKNSWRPIIKFIRVNLMLDWLAHNFNSRIIFIVRHPGAVAASKIAASQTQGGAAWDFNGPIQQSILAQYKQDANLGKDYLDKYSDIFSEKLSIVAGHTLIWCIENILPIYTQQRKRRYVFFYEDIVNNPEMEFYHMLKILGLEHKPDKSIIVRPSQQASNEMKSSSFRENLLTMWMNRLTRQQLCEIDGILKFFKVTIYNAFEPLPVSRTQNIV